MFAYFFFRLKMKRNVDVETLTECAEDLSLYNMNKRSKRLTTALSKIIPSILRKTTVDYVFLAILENDKN